jgi:hypothetical protein
MIARPTASTDPWALGLCAQHGLRGVERLYPATFRPWTPIKCSERWRSGRRKVGETARAVVAIVAYIGAITVSLVFFLYSVGRVVGGAQPGPRSIALLIVAGVWLLFAIDGGYVWFRFMSVAA